MQGKPCKLSWLCSKMMIPSEKGYTLSLVIILLYRILKFETFLIKIQSRESKVLKNKDRADLAVLTKEIMSTIRKL